MMLVEGGFYMNRMFKRIYISNLLNTSNRNGH